MYKAIVFDFFDVIHRDPFQHWLKQAGLPRAGAIHESSQRLDRGQISDEEHFEELSRLSGHKVESIREFFDDTTLINNEMVELIKELKRSYKIGLISNTSTDYIRRIFDQHGLAQLFDVTVISADLGIIKPEPEIFTHTLTKLNVPAEDAIFIDDNPTNVAAATDLGITGLVFTDDRTLRDDLHDLSII